MKFLLESAERFEYPGKKNLEVLEQNGFFITKEEVNREEDGIREIIYYRWFIQIPDVDSILKMMEVLDCPVVIYKDPSTIKIYDGYLE